MKFTIPTDPKQLRARLREVWHHHCIAEHAMFAIGPWEPEHLPCMGDTPKAKELRAALLEENPHHYDELCALWNAAGQPRLSDL